MFVAVAVAWCGEEKQVGDGEKKSDVVVVAPVCGGGSTPDPDTPDTPDTPDPAPTPNSKLSRTRGSNEVYTGNARRDADDNCPVVVVVVVVVVEVVLCPDVCVCVCV